MTAVTATEIGYLPEKDAWAFEALKELFVREKGFDLEAYKERCILRRIYLKVRANGHGDLGTYYRVLSKDPEELERLFQYLTINVTEFFRNPTAFEYLERKVLPGTMTRLGNRRRFRIWSAGCSSGEEPYSLAFMILRVRRKYGIRTPFEILATDVDRAILERGREGVYTREALKNLGDAEIGEFFTSRDGGYRVNDNVRKHVTFQAADILREGPEERQNLIVCRNLLIYFSRENQEHIIAGFSRALEEGGHLMLGKAETLIGRNREFFESVSPTERIYRLRDDPLAEGFEV